MTPANDLVSAIVIQLVGQAPVLLAYLIGIVFALVFWSRYPRAGLLLFLGTVWLFVNAIVSAAAFPYLVAEHGQWGWSVAKLGAVTSMIGVVNSMSHALGFALVLAAVFVDRRPAPAPASDAAAHGRSAMAAR